MISKFTKVLLLAAVIGVGTAQVWQYRLDMTYEKSTHSPIVYSLDVDSGKFATNRPTGSMPGLRGALGRLGMLALLLALPLLVKDITHGKQSN